MSASLLFWVLFLLWAVFYLLGIVGHVGVYWASGNILFIFALLALLGWRVFGKPVQG